VRAADTLSSYGRHLLLTAMVEDPQTAAQVTLPRFLQRQIVARLLLRFVHNRLRAKYPQRVTRDDVRTALLLLRTSLGKTGGAYICGPDFTYADICMASSMYFAVERRKGVAGDKVYGDNQLLAEFEDLVQWRRRIFDKHYPGTELDAYKFRPPVYGN
jgi:glutathione S-transferase